MKNLDYQLLTRLFSRNTLLDLIRNNNTKIYYECVKKYMEDCPTENMSNRVIFEFLYDIFKKKYRNEYFYKNTIINKKLLGVHSINTTVALAEVPIYKSKADFILINGKGVVFEIKSDLDNLDRLSSQIEDYYKVFTHVCVVSNEEQSKKIIDLFPNDAIGVMTLTNKNQFRNIRKIKEDSSKLNYREIFKVMRKSEYEKIIIKYFGALPKTSQIEYYEVCFGLISQIPISTLHTDFLSELKNRNLKYKEEFKTLVPKELRYLTYFANFKLNDYKELSTFLNKNYGG